MSYVEKRIGFCTDLGGRKKNEDSVLCFLNLKEANNLELGIGVADGMGSYSGGEIASQFITKEIEYLFKSGHYLSFARKLETNFKNFPYLFKMAVEDVNERLYVLRTNDDAHKNMGSTFTGAIGYEMELYLAHVGDSRVYRIREGKIKCITEDHTIKTKLQKEKCFSMVDGIPRTHNYDHISDHILYRSVGYRPWIKMDFHLLKALQNDVYLFCTDGLYNFVDEEAILRITMHSNLDPSLCTQKLVDLAKSNGCNDNVSVVCLFYVNCMGLEMSKNQATERLELQ
jgi:protein phosphatase